MANKLTHCFWDVDMRMSHPGLIALAKKKKVDLKALAEGECALFLNRAQNRIKMFASGTECLLYVSKTHRIDPEAIRLLPCYLSGGEINYTAALREAINTHMERKNGKSKGKK